MALAVVYLHRIAMVPVAGNENAAFVEFHATSCNPVHVKASEFGKAMSQWIVDLRAVELSDAQWFLEAAANEQFAV